MEWNFCPVSVVPAVPRDEGIRFLHPKVQYDITVFTPVIWQILSEADGRQKASKIIMSVAKRFEEEVDASTIEMIMQDLIQIGVLIDSREIAKHFHDLSVNPMLFSRDLTFGAIRQHTESKRLPLMDGEKIEMGNLLNPSSLGHMHEMRTSCRSFSDQPLHFEDVANVLMHSYSLSRTPSPSAGGLYPIKVYFIVTRELSGLSPGYYEFDPENDVCVRYGSDVDIELLKHAFDSDSLLYSAPVIIVLAADMDRHIIKYSNRGYRYTLLEAGHVAQNIQLIATECGLSVLEYGGFSDQVLATELQMDYPRVAPLITLGIGYASDEPAFNSTLLLEELEEFLVGTKRPVNYVRIISGGESGESEDFFAAAALYKCAPGQNASSSYKDRFSGGTATSSSLAQVKALAEAYERYASGQLRIDKVSRADELGSDWLDLRKVAPLTGEQYDILDHLSPFDPSENWQWVKGEKITSGQSVWIPIDLVFYPLNSRYIGRSLAYEASSSGVAAFTNEKEAVERGLLELIERDSVMRNWFKREGPVKVPARLLPYHWRRRVSYWNGRGRDVYVLDMSSHGVVTVNVLIVSPDQFPCFVNGSSSSIVSFEEAVGKAFHEAELGLTQALKSRPHRKIDPRSVLGPMDHAKLYAHTEYFGNLEWLWSGDEADQVPVPGADADDLYVRFEAIKVLLSPDDSPLKVVRVISEHLVPINFGWSSEHYSHRTIHGKDVHPDSLLLPHYFA